MLTAFATAETELSVLWAIAISILAVFLQFYTTGKHRIFVVPSFVALLFATGHPLSLGALVNQSAGIPSDGWGSVGRFAFTNDAMTQPFLTIASGVCGIAVGTRLSEMLWTGLRSRTVLRKAADPSYYSLIAWALLCAAVIAICALLGIGRVGLSDAAELPFRLGGILVIGRGYLLPVLGARLVQQALDAEGQKRLIPALFMVAAVGAVASFGSLSRGLGALYMVPVMMFVVFHQSSRGRPIRRLGIVAGLMVAVLAIGGFVVSVQRTTVYAGDGWMSASEFAGETEQGGGFLGSVLNGSGALIGDRLGGVSVFLALMSGPGRHPDLWAPIEIMNGDDLLIEQVSREALGFVPETSGGLAFGVGLTLWGLLGLGGPVFMPFLGSLVLMLLVCSIEGSLAYYGEEGMGAVLGCLVAFNEWGQPSLFYLSRQAAVLVLVLAIARQGSRILNRSRSLWSPSLGDA
jgi:hypothetical protein